MKNEESVKGLNRNIPLPKNRYAIQCVEEEFKASSKDNLMVVRKWEIIDPPTIGINGETIDIMGTTMTQYLTTKVVKDDGNGQKVTDEEKTRAAMGRVFEDYKTLGLKCDEIDENNPHLGAKGLVANAICSSKEYQQCKDPTPEQLAKGQKQGDPILDDNNKPIKGFQVQLNQILGLSSVKPVEAPY